MKKINHLSFIFALFIYSSVMNASCITLVGGNTIYAVPPSYSFGNSGTLSGLATGNYIYSFTRSGGFTTSNLAIALNGSGWTPGTFATLLSSNSIAISGFIPTGVGCGQTETVVMTIKDILGNTVCTYTFYITKTPQSISGSEAICINSNGIYSVNSPVAPGGSYVWTTNTSGWLINGMVSPVTTITNSVTLTSPATKGTTSLCVSNPNMCESLCFTVSSNDLATPVFTGTHPLNVCKLNSAYWHVNAVPGATGYTWSFTGLASPTGLTLNPSGTSCEIIGNVLGGYQVKVKATNSCGAGAQLSGPITVINNSTCLKRTMKETEDADPIIYDDSKVLLYPNPANQLLAIEITSIETGIYTISLYDMLGKKHNTYSINTEKGFNKASLDLSNLENGIYLLVIDNGISSQKQRVLVNH